MNPKDLFSSSSAFCKSFSDYKYIYGSDYEEVIFWYIFNQVFIA